MWYEMKSRTTPDTVGLIADVTVSAGSPWFDGHFPDQPVLPGIAQLDIVFDLIRRHAGQPLRMVAVNRVRFKQIIVPDARLTVVAAPRQADDSVWNFRLENTAGLVTTGTMQVAIASKQQ